MPLLSLLPRRLAVLSFLLLGALSGRPAPAADFSLSFAHPEHYTDASLDPYTYGVDGRVLDALQQILDETAARCLLPGQSLAIEVDDVDLAGRFEWWHRPQAGDVRVMRDITWPRLALSYTFRDGDQPPRQGREQVMDMNYLAHSRFVAMDTRPLPYERALLSDWFQHRFCAAG